MPDQLGSLPCQYRAGQLLSEGLDSCDLNTSNYIVSSEDRFVISIKSDKNFNLQLTLVRLDIASLNL